MNRKLFYSVFWGVFLLVTNLSAQVYPRKKAMGILSRGLIANLHEDLKNAAVLNFVNLDGTVSMFGKHIAEEMSTGLAKWGDFTIIERALIEKVIDEQKYALSDFVDLTKAASLGKLIGAEGIVIGTIAELEKSFQVNARIIQTETGEVLSTSGVEIKKDADTIKLASQIIVVPKPEKKAEKKPEVVKEPEPIKQPEAKVERSVVKEELEEKIFYFEDFSEVKDGDLPDGWLGGEKLMIKTIEKGKKVLTPFVKKVEQKIMTNSIKFPEDWSLELIISLDLMGIEIGNLQINFRTWSFDMGEVTMKRTEDTKGRLMRIAILKQSNKFCLKIDGVEKILVRKNDFKEPEFISFRVGEGRYGTDFKLHSIKGIDLTEKNKQQ